MAKVCLHIFENSSKNPDLAAVQWEGVIVDGEEEDECEEEGGGGEEVPHVMVVKEVEELAGLI